MDKPFKTIDEQISILKSRGMSVDEKTKYVLEREGYYQVINGYKDLFLDRSAMEQIHDDRFVRGTTFHDVYRLFTFDRELRTLLMQEFAKAEATLKTVCAYQFTAAHPDEKNPYLDISNYSNRVPNDVKSRLISEFESAIGSHPRETRWKKKAYLTHYIYEHNREVPLWVLMNYATLGQAFKFFCFMPDPLRNEVARTFSRLYSETHSGAMRIHPHSLRLTYDHIKDFRNICAHDERLYCARTGPSKDVSIMQTVSELRIILTKEDYEALCEAMSLKIATVIDALPSVSKELLESMGYGDMDFSF